MTVSLKFYKLLLGMICFTPIIGVCSEISNFSVTLSQDLELDIKKYSANGTDLLLFIYPTSSKGIDRHHDTMAQELANANIEVWLADLTDALFLPHSSSTMRKFTGEYLAELVVAAHSATGKNIVIAGNSYAAIPVLRGAYQWQKSNPKIRYLKNAILFTPKLYKTLPPLGQDPKYLPIVSATSLPLIIFQGKKHGNKWQLPNLLKALHSSNPNIYVEMMPEISSLFAGKSVTEEQTQFFKILPSKLSVISKLQTGNTPLRVPKNISFDTITDTGIDSRLKNYTGQVTPSPINLLDYAGNNFELSDYKGKVTIVNFWATWCTPCVKEIPSLNRLKALMQNKPFELVSINFQETTAAILEFQKLVNVKFPVLMDTDGKIANGWKVVAFPSTFIVGSDGNIRYGVNAGIEWDTPEVIEKINSLF